MAKPIITKVFPTIQNYDWGKSASDSIIPSLIQDTVIHQNHKYAELWFGDHAKSPSLIGETRETASTINTFLQNYSKKSLPFLFKILSIAKPLSIQFHPTKEQAELLHAENPDLYKDDNHKPELSFALTDVTLLLGFREFEELIKSLSSNHPIFEILVDVSSVKEAVEKLFSFSESQIEVFQNKIKQYCDRQNALSAHEQLFISNFDSTNAKDIGYALLFLLEYKRLAPNQICYIAPGTPHAYLSGEMIECMACSDNVIRGGLTTKHVDKKNFLKFVNFSKINNPSLSIDNKVEKGKSFCSNSIFSEFVLIINNQVPLVNINCADNQTFIFFYSGTGEISLSGESYSLQKGDAYLLISDSTFAISSENALWCCIQANE